MQPSTTTPTLIDADVKKHSLTPAVTDGTLTEQAAFCGLVERLSTRHAESLVRVRFRTARADGRTIMPIGDLARWTRDNDMLVADGRRWKNEDVLDVFPISLVTGATP